MNCGVPELLAPAGDWESLRAAVANGADAVYFGLDALNARQRATNFKVAELPEVIAHLHDHNVRGYVTLNTLVFTDELPPAAEYVRAIADSGADAVIVQDVGLLALIRRLAPTLPIHASTQMTQTEAEGIEFLRELGVSRVIVARELSLIELARLVEDTPLPLEVFVHGALCISFSGQCLASEALWGRSANRGQCGQACRLPYQLVVDGHAVQFDERDYRLSAQDLAAYDRIPELTKLGIAAVKIEGRLKSAHYVAAATRMYRAALDAAARGTPFTPAPTQEEELVQSFSRGLSHGYLDGLNHQQLVHGRFPHKRGQRVGTVVSKTARSVIVELLPGSPGSAPLKPGDGVVFDEGHPERDEQGGRVYTVEPAPSSRWALTFGAGDVNLAAISIGSAVWKTDDPAIRRRLESTYARDTVLRRVRVNVVAEIGPEQTLTITLRDTSGNSAQVTTDQPLAPAQKHPLSSALLREQLGRLGDTPFELGGVELRGPGGPCASLPFMAPKSVLNDLRRRAVTALNAKRATAARHLVEQPDALDRLRASLQRPVPALPMGSPDMSVLVRDLHQLQAVLAWTPPDAAFPPGQSPAATGLIYCDFQYYGDYLRALELARAAGRSVALATPQVVMPGEMGSVAQIAALHPAAALVRSLGVLRHLRRCAPQLALIGDYTLNVVNDLSAAGLAEAGLARVTPGLDLNGSQWLALLTYVPADRLEVVLHGHVPLFHSRHCLFAAALSDGTRCGDCGCRCRSHELALRDRNGAVHPVLVDGLGRNMIFHAAAQTAGAFLTEMRHWGVRHFRVELLRETPDHVHALLDIYANLLAGTVPPSDALRQLRAVCPGGLTPGTFAGE